MDNIRWGIISTAKIAREQVIPALQSARNCTVVALASRDHLRAEQMASEMNIPNAYDSYQKMLEDPGIDAVYNPLPNHLHVPVTLQAMQAGKHVLCEKPIATDAEEAVQLIEASETYPDIKVMEAFMYRFHPQWDKAKELIREGTIGEVMHVHSVFTYNNTDPDNIRNKPEYGGGGLMDIGCYSISSARYIFGAEPDKVLGHQIIDPQMKVDILTTGILAFGNQTASFMCSTQSHRSQHLTIYGTSGEIEFDLPFNPPNNDPAELILRTEGHEKVYSTEPCNQYTRQAEKFVEAISTNTPVPTPLTDAVNNMRVIDAMKSSAMADRWISV